MPFISRALLLASNVHLGRCATRAALVWSVICTNNTFASVVVSTHPTKHMTCSGGVCEPTAIDAVLNVDDLNNYISQQGNVTVTTSGSGVEAGGIVIDAPVSWSQASVTMNAETSILVNAPISVGAATSELEIVITEGYSPGALSFGSKGHISFASPSDIFGINGAIVTLVNSVHGLANAVKANPSALIALTKNYDAGRDGIYSRAPVTTPFGGIFEGLGNSISNLAVDDPRKNQYVGLFGMINSPAVVENLRLIGILVAGGKGTALGGESVGGLTGVSSGTLQSDDLSGTISANSELGPVPYAAAIGGLAGQNLAGGTIANSQSEGIVLGRGQNPAVGGLVGINFGLVSLSRSSAKVQARIFADLAGFVGGNYGSIEKSFSTGTVTTGASSWVSGFVAFSCGTISNSYSTGGATSRNGGNAMGSFVGVNGAALNGNGSCVPGKVNTSFGTGLLSTTRGYVGGFVGYDNGTSGTLKHNYWDTDTTGITKLSQGAGNVANDPGIKGKTTAQLQSGLPKGFSRKVWAENPSINDGFPYLIANPPSK